MEAVLITVYLIIVVAMIAVILLQRSEGGGLGMGTAGSNGLMTVRGSANLLTRTTAILAALFMATAIGLTILSQLDRGSESILQRAADSVGEGAETPTTVLDALNALQDDTGDAASSSEDTSAPASDPALAVPPSVTTEAPAGSSSDQGAAGAGEPPADNTPAAPIN